MFGCSKDMYKVILFSDTYKYLDVAVIHTLLVFLLQHAGRGGQSLHTGRLGCRSTGQDINPAPGA